MKNKEIEFLIKRHTQNLKDLEAQDKHIRTRKFREETIKQFKEDKEKAQKVIKGLKADIKKYETISKGDPLKQADDHIKAMLSTSADAIRKTNITLEALKQYKEK